MDYFAGLDISMDETHICVLDRDGAVVYEGKSASMAETIADELAKAPGLYRPKQALTDAPTERRDGTRADLLWLIANRSAPSS